MAEIKEKTESKKFSAEVGKVLQLVIHSLYTNKDIFLRELISNASDACDKLRYLALSDDKLIGDDKELKIKVLVDKKAKTITISDNGIGMGKKDLIDNLGTIARSGTQNFIQKISGETKSDVNLIGQFGVGFYSAFMIAEEVKVISKKAGENKAHEWVSKGEGEYEISELDAKNIKRGTEITLNIREKDEEFLDKFRLHHIIKTYSDHISFPIELEDKEDGEKEIVNSAKALWLKPKSEIKEEQYYEFYKSIAHAIDKPFMVLHNKAEGNLEYTNLLFVPSEKPFDLYSPERSTRVKLYVKRVFITEENLDIIPRHLRFLRGIVDSEDLPLNISRETLQNNAILKKIKKSITSKVLTEIKKKSEKDEAEYLKFWNNFGACLKEGLCDSLENKDEILDVCRFSSSEFPEKLITIDDYIKNMKEGQEDIYFITGDDAKQLSQSPQIEGFKAKGINVILLSDHVDDFWTTVVFEYKGKQFKSITRSGIELDKIKNEKEEASQNKEEKTDDLEGLVNFFRETLGEKVKDVVVSKKLVESPVCLTSPEGTLDLRMEKFLHEQKQILARSAKILEINTGHAVVKEIAKKLTEKKLDEAKDSAIILFDLANIMAGENVDDPSSFMKKISKLLQN